MRAAVAPLAFAAGIALAADARRPNSTQRGYDHRWARTRGRYLKHQPTCQHPGCTAPATEVHHLDGRGPTGPDGHRWHNLQALCKTHHARITAREQPGGWNAAPPRRRAPEPHPGLIGGGGDPPSARRPHRRG